VCKLPLLVYGNNVTAEGDTANHIETTSSENVTTTCTANVRDVEGSDEQAVHVYQRPTDTCSVSLTQPTDVNLSTNKNTRKKMG